MPRDRLQYCEWILWEHARDPGFLEHVLSSDQSGFTREGVLKSVTATCGHSIYHK